MNYIGFYYLCILKYTTFFATVKQKYNVLTNTPETLDTSMFLPALARSQPILRSNRSIIDSEALPQKRPLQK